jgi:hypothetical protein
VRPATLALAAAATTLCLSITGCGSPREVDPFQLEGNRLTVTNRTPDAWHAVEIQINRQYRVAVPTIIAGQRFDVSLDAFLDVYGNHFYYRRQQIKDVHLTATRPGGAPIDMHMALQRGGLDGLADSGVGIFKKKEDK